MVGRGCTRLQTDRRRTSQLGKPHQSGHSRNRRLQRLKVRTTNCVADGSSTRLADSLERIPLLVDIPYLSFSGPLSLASIKGKPYSSLRDFDLDMVRLFEKARRWHPTQSPAYGYVLVLQRLYNALTAPHPLSLPASGFPEASPTLFSSLRAGPGNARSLHEANQELKAGAAEDEVGFGITTYRVGSKDRTFTDEARHKGMSFRCGDYVHLINPDDATRPIIGQVWKSFIPTKGYQTHHVTICWYYRPEQVSTLFEQADVRLCTVWIGCFSKTKSSKVVTSATIQSKTSSSEFHVSSMSNTSVVDR